MARKDITYQTIDLKKSSRVKICDICAVKLQTNSTTLIICCIYRAPSGRIHQLLELLDDTLKCLCQSFVEFILCGDININYLTASKNKLKPNTIMNTYNLQKVANLPTRVPKNEGTLTDNIFLDKAKQNCI
jgi:hypothetical protein